MEPNLLQEAWASVASPYHAFWSPRFQPFLADALAAFQPAAGPLAVPGCGPGDEALALARRFPERRILASDPAAPMRELLEARAHGLPNLEVAPGTALELSLTCAGGVFSSFTLQLLPEREATLAAWGRCLGPQGRIAAVFWPRQAEGDAWGALGRAIEAEASSPRPEWEGPLRASLPSLGLELLEARDLRHSIAYASPQEAWEQLRDACSLQVLLRRLGPERAEACGRRWLKAHGLRELGGAWVHSPVARLWILGPSEGRLGA